MHVRRPLYVCFMPCLPVSISKIIFDTANSVFFPLLNANFPNDKYFYFTLCDCVA